MRDSSTKNLLMHDFILLDHAILILWKNKLDGILIIAAIAILLLATYSIDITHNLNPLFVKAIAILIQYVLTIAVAHWVFSRINRLAMGSLVATSAINHSVRARYFAIYMVVGSALIVAVVSLAFHSAMPGIMWAQWIAAPGIIIASAIVARFAALLRDYILEQNLPYRTEAPDGCDKMAYMPSPAREYRNYIIYILIVFTSVILAYSARAINSNLSESASLILVAIFGFMLSWILHDASYAVIRYYQYYRYSIFKILRIFGHKSWVFAFSYIFANIVFSDSLHMKSAMVACASSVFPIWFKTVYTSNAMLCSSHAMSNIRSQIEVSLAIASVLLFWPIGLIAIPAHIIYKIVRHMRASRSFSL